MLTASKTLSLNGRMIEPPPATRPFVRSVRRPLDRRLAIAGHAMRTVYSRLKAGDWVGAAMSAASALIGFDGPVGRLGNAAIRAGQVYKTARAAGDGRWAAAMTGLAAATGNSQPTGATPSAADTANGRYGLVMAGATRTVGSPECAQGAMIAAAFHHRHPEVALRLLGQMTGRSRLVACGSGRRTVRERDVGALIAAVDHLSAELKGAVLGQLDMLADTLPPEAQEVLKREAAFRARASTRLVSAVLAKNPDEALRALGTLAPRVTKRPGRRRSIDGRDPEATVRAASALSDELRAAATAQLMRAANQLPPTMRSALERQMRTGFANATSLVNSLRNGDPDGTLRALGGLSGTDRLQALGRDSLPPQERDVPILVNAVWNLSPDLRSAAFEHLDRISRKLPSATGRRLRAEMRSRFTGTVGLLRAVQSRDTAGAMATLARLTDSSGLKGIATGVDGVRRRDVPSLAKALDALPPEVRGHLWEQLDCMVTLLPTSVREAWQHEKDVRSLHARTLTRAIVDRRADAIIEALRAYGKRASPPSFAIDIDPSAEDTGWQHLSPWVRETASAALTTMEARLRPAVRSAVRRILSVQLGVPLPAKD